MSLDASHQKSSPRVAIVHDEFVRRGGAERVVEELLRLYPQSDVYALYASNHPYLSVDGKRHLIHTTFLQSLPLWFRRHPRRLVALLPHAVERLDVSQYDIVISSSSAFAKGVITRSSIPHICYCHTPTRYVWERQQAGPLQAFGQHILRLADFAAAQRPDVYVANSTYTQERITHYYRRKSTVVHPPIQTTFFTPAAASRSYFLIVGRLTSAKNFEHAIQVCEKLQLPLHVVGVGAHYTTLKRLAGKYTTFLGKLTDEQLREQYRGAWALLQPGIEDFGIASVEALACGTPVIGVRQGGILDIVTSNAHGVLYPKARPEHLAEAVRLFFERQDTFEPYKLQQAALKFSRTRFAEYMKNTVEEALSSPHTIYKDS